MADLGDALRALIEHGPALRAAGYERVMLPDGLSFTLRAAAPAHPSGVAAPPPPDADDDGDPVADAQREERELRKHWDAHWKRITASSGAAIPPFPGVDVVRRNMGALRVFGFGGHDA